MPKNPSVKCALIHFSFQISCMHRYEQSHQNLWKEADSDQVFSSQPTLTFDVVDNS